MPQIESLGLFGFLGREIGYTGVNTGDTGRLKVRTHSLNLTKLRYDQTLIKSV